MNTSIKDEEYKELQSVIKDKRLKSYLIDLASKQNRHEADDKLIIVLAEICKQTAIVSGKTSTTIAVSNVGTPRDMEYIKKIFEENEMCIDMVSDNEDYMMCYYKISWD